MVIIMQCKDVSVATRQSGLLNLQVFLISHLALADECVTHAERLSKKGGKEAQKPATAELILFGNFQIAARSFYESQASF